MGWRSRSRGTLVVIALIAIVTGAVAGAIAAGTRGSGTTHYRSQTVLLFDQTRAIASAGDGGVLVKLSLVRGKYVDLLQTAEITRPVALATGLPESAIRGAVQAVAPPNQFVVDVTATWPTAADAPKIATAAASQLIAYSVREQAAAGVPAADRIAISVVTPATPAVEVRASRKRTVAIAAAVAVGAALVVAAGAVAALALADRRRR